MELSTIDQPSYSAKLLLFGEYTIVNGGSALAIPYDKYQGRWAVGTEDAGLQPFFEHLSGLEGCLLDRLQVAISNKWIFETDIPMGYGLGSSGALSAAAYKTFFKKEDLALEDLKNRLSEIESFFHGKSSGLDPLVCYTRMAVHIKEGNIRLLDPPTLPQKLTLYDSGLSRNGKPLIQYYLNRLKEEQAFAEVVVNLGRFNQRIITELLDGQDISQSFKEISRLQFRYFKQMIPDSIQAIWKRGLQDNSYYMKLAGAGGGGCFLVWGEV